MLSTLQTIIQRVNAASNLDEALTIIVHRVKAAMQADVCSVYVREPKGPRYVLMATEGLKPGAVGRIRMAPGEGIVGLVAARQEPINVANASLHPSYRHFPEADERKYRGFLAVPLVHFRETLGVLVVQQRTERVFVEEDVAFLVTIGAQIAASLNYVTEGNVVARNGDSASVPVGLIQGLPGAPGVAIGTICLPSPLADLDAVADRVPDNVVAEEVRFRKAVLATQQELRESADRLEGQLSAETRAIFNVYILILGQDDLIDGVVAHIQRGNWAPGALRDEIAMRAKMFEQADDPYLQARAEDIRGLGRRILLHLSSGAPPSEEHPDDAILVGDEVSLARAAAVPPGKLKGIACLHGSVVSHTAVLARGLGIPAVMGLGHRDLHALDRHPIIVDGYRGRVFIDPAPGVIREYRRLVRSEGELSARLENMRDAEPVTRDGIRIRLGLNVGLLTDIEVAGNLAIDEVGLYRSEFPFMSRDTFPMEHEQYEIYRKILRGFASRPVTMRTLDVGGDKPLPYFPIAEENPFLGWRGIRLTLDHPDIFLPQLRAMLRANVGVGNLRIMFPMIGQFAELKAAREAVERAWRELLEEGCECPMPAIGAMLEVPSALHSIPALARHADFFSIGTNDLTQYLLAVDRNNPNVARLYEHLDPAVLRVLHNAIRTARRCNRPISVCGEMAADPGSAILLIGMGLQSVSVSASALLRLKWTIRNTSVEHAQQVLRQALRMESGKAVRQLLDDELREAGLGALVVQ